MLHRKTTEYCRVCVPGRTGPASGLQRKLQRAGWGKRSWPRWLWEGLESGNPEELRHVITGEAVASGDPVCDFWLYHNSMERQTGNSIRVIPSLQMSQLRHRGESQSWPEVWSHVLRQDARLQHQDSNTSLHVTVTLTLKEKAGPWSERCSDSGTRWPSPTAGRGGGWWKEMGPSEHLGGEPARHSDDHCFPPWTARPLKTASISTLGA